MIDEVSAKKAIIYTLVAVGLYLIVRKRQAKRDDDVFENNIDKPNSVSINATNNRTRIVLPDLSNIDTTVNPRAKDAVSAVKAYSDAWNNDETDDFMSELNDELMKSFGVTITHSQKELVAKDYDNNNILVVKIHH